MRRLLARLVALLAAAACAGAALAPAALGHASFEGSDPAAGARVEVAPRQVTLVFSEGLNRHLSRASLVDVTSGHAVPVARRLAGDRRLVLMPRTSLERGAYRVDWESVSTTDGHLLEGSFGFGVRVAAAASGSLERSPLASGGWARALVRWALYAALLLFAGGLLVRALLGRRWPAPETSGPSPRAGGGGNGAHPGPPDADLAKPTLVRSPAEGGGVATLVPTRAAAGTSPEAKVDRAAVARADAVISDAGLAAVALAAVAAALEAALAARGLSGAALRDYLLANLPGVARIAVVALAALALWLARRAPRWAALAAVAALLAVVVSGHANSADPRGVAIVADVIHLLGAAVWLGGAGVLVLAWGPALRDAATRRRVARTVLPEFGRVALPAFAVVVVAGVVNAAVELGRIPALWETGYGVVLMTKVALVAAAATIAWLHAYRLRPRMTAVGGDASAPLTAAGADEPTERSHWRALRAEPLLSVAVVAAASLLVAFPLPPLQLSASVRSGGGVPACNSCPLPAPAAGELAVAGEAGGQTVAAWIRRRGDSLTGSVRALDFRGQPARGTPRVPGAQTAACGSGCTTFALAPAPAALRVVVSENGRAYAAALPARWDPAAGARARRLLARAEATMRGLRSVVEDERVTSGPGTQAVARYWLSAPDRLAYRTGTGAESVEIGGRQWIRTPGVPWTEAPIPGGLPFRTRTWFRWTPYAQAIALLGERAGVAQLALMDPGTPVWIRLAIETRTGRVLREQLVAPARFIDHRFHSFDRPVVIRAPRGAVSGD